VDEAALIDKDIVAYLQRHETKELLRFVIVGSVDDGKSTLVGRLLHDLNAVYDDQLAAVKRATTMEGEAIDFSLFTDGLAAEREQGITIDVAYRYFATEGRKFIVADTPGHVQYTRNMVTGASTADVGVILIDARLGVLQQSRRHAYLASLLGIPHLLVAVNKMDLRDYSQALFEQIRDEFRGFCSGLRFTDVTFVPVSALKGENVAKPATSAMPWYDGPTVLGFLESVPIAADRNLADLRYPVQYVLRPNLNYRGFAGQVSSGVVKKGDAITILPSGRTSRIKAIDTFEGELEEAFAPLSVTLRLEDEVDCSRGDMIVHSDNRPRVQRRFSADVVWMHERPLDLKKSYFLKHTTRVVRMQVDKVEHKIDLERLAHVDAETLGLNDIGRLTITCHQPLYYDAYAKNRATGSFVIVDSLNNNTVGAGMILDGAAEKDGGGELGSRTQVSPSERAEKTGQLGRAILLAGDGAVELAYSVERRLFDLGRAAYVLHGEHAPAASLALALKSLAEAGLVALCPVPAGIAAELRGEFVLLDAASDVESVVRQIDAPAPA
jgi:bifunctional enzyme CysN/CysC